jgi:serine/threonine protein kinase
MIQAVSPPLPAACRGSFKCYVEAEGHMYEVFWEGSQCYPDFDSVALRPVKMSDEMALTWSHSNFVDFGSNAVVRECNEGDFMIVKIAHPTAEARQLIQHEYDFMRNLAGLPAPKVDPQPLTDHDGIYGFRMEYLWKIDFQELHGRGNEVWEAVGALHGKGMCHGDLSPSNVMSDKEGRLVLIDFSFSGFIGQDLPAYIPTWVYGSRIFNRKTDLQRFDRFFKRVPSI